jgi:release factor glutamine methyltransferase
MSWKKMGKYHAIVSNPPYVTKSEKVLMHRNVTDFEPDEALFVPDHNPLLFYRAIAGFATSHLIPAGRLYFEINERYGLEVSELLRSIGFEEIQLRQDFHGKDRFLSAILKSPSTLPG